VEVEIKSAVAYGGKPPEAKDLGGEAQGATGIKRTLYMFLCHCFQSPEESESFQEASPYWSPGEEKGERGRLIPPYSGRRRRNIGEGTEDPRILVLGQG